jgi:hypothetical protein
VNVRYTARTQSAIEGPAPSLTTAQVRYTWIVNKRLHVTGGIEDPDSQITSPTGGAKAIAPDVTLRGRYEAGWGHVQLAGVLRELAIDDGTGADDRIEGYGVHLAGSWKTVGDDNFVGAVVWGKGIARYISDIGGDDLDAQFQNGQLDALTAKVGYIGYAHYWNPKVRSTGVAGWLEMDNESFQPPPRFARVNIIREFDLESVRFTQRWHGNVVRRLPGLRSLSR